MRHLIKRQVGPNKTTDQSDLLPRLLQEASATSLEVNAPHNVPEPIEEEVAVGQSSGQSQNRPTPISATKVCLIVDDSRVVRKISSKIVRSMGYVPVEAQDGEDALARCKKAMPRLVLTDWSMPEMDGLEFVKRLRAIPTTHPPVIVFCTSKGTAADVNAGVRAGANDYIVKPFKEETLRAKLERFGPA